MGSGAGMMPTGGLMGSGSGVLSTNPASYMPGLATNPANNAAANGALSGAASSFQNAQNQANQANANLANQINAGYNTLGQQQANGFGGLSGLFGQQQNQFGQTTGNALNGWGQLLNNITQGYGNIGQGYQNVENQVMNNLSLLGSSQAQDINQAYQQQAANAQQDLANRGLGNTTINQSTTRGIDLDRQRALMANAQGVQQQINQALMNTAYPALQQQNNAIGSETGVAAQGLGQQYQGAQDMANLQNNALQFGQNAINAQTALGQGQLGFMNSINQTGPDMNMLAALAQALGSSGYGYGNPQALAGLARGATPTNYPAINPPAFTPV
jgi:hypothetical protein